MKVYATFMPPKIPNSDCVYSWVSWLPLTVEFEITSNQPQYDFYSNPISSKNSSFCLTEDYKKVYYYYHKEKYYIKLISIASKKKEDKILKFISERYFKESEIREKNISIWKVLNKLESYSYDDLIKISKIINERINNKKIKHYKI